MYLLLTLMNILDYDVADAEPIIPLDEGDYPIRCVSVEVVPSKSSPRSNVKISLAIMEGDFKGRNLTRFITLPVADDKENVYDDGRTAHGAMLDRLFKTFEGLGAPVKKGKKPDTSLLIGQEGIARVRNRPVTDSDIQPTGEQRAECVAIFQPRKKD